MQRKKFIKLSGLGILTTALSPTLTFCNLKPQKRGVQGAGRVNPDFNPDMEVRLTSAPADIQLFTGAKTQVFTYHPALLKGDDFSLQTLQNSYLGPIIKVKQGQKVRVYYKNQLSDVSIIHWHGLHLPQEMDGHPMYVIDNGEEYVYEFQVNNRPGTYWFHPHPHGITGPQVYGGLAGLFIVEDNERGLPSGEQDVPLVIQDRTFNTDNQLVYLQNNRMAPMTGFLGNQILINGRPDNSMEVTRGTYRFRVLNGSNSRIYKLAWSDGEEVTVIGTDGGLLSRPIHKSYLMLAPGERAEIWRDFSEQNSGDEISLISLSFNSGTAMGMMGGRGMGGGMMGGMGQSASVTENGDPFTLVAFKLLDREGEKQPLPESFSPVDTIDVDQAVNRDAPRQFNFHFQRMQWLINGQTFEMYEVADWEKVKLNTTEIWEFINGGSSGGMMGNMMSMPHPVHVHGLQFQILERDVSDVPRSVWQTMGDGFVNEGWQDTFLLLPGMKVKVALRFKDHTGKFIYHCHNLEHEDMGMMRNYEVINE